MARTKRRDVALHTLRIAACIAVLATSPRWEIAVVASAALFFAAFAFAHDASHGALGLSRRANTAALSLSALVMLISGHAMRRMHLRHHARPLSEGDVEGAGAQRSALGALLGGPANALALRIAAFRGARRRERVVQAVETAAGLAVVATALLVRSAPLRAFVVVALVLQMSMGLWASHMTHHAPEWLATLCKRLSFLRSPVLLSLAYHELHHRRPGVPCQDLAREDHRRANAALVVGASQRIRSGTAKTIAALAIPRAMATSASVQPHGLNGANAATT